MRTDYESPQIEVMEIEFEDAILSGSSGPTPFEPFKPFKPGDGFDGANW